MPTDEREAAGSLDGPLGDRMFDDAYVAPAAGAPFVLDRDQGVFGGGIDLARLKPAT